MKKDIKIIIGVAAYNAEKHIKELTESLLKQKGKGFLIEKILVYSDCSTDNTVNILNTIKNYQLEVVQGKTRHGFAGTVKYFIDRSKNNDALVLLNDDIFIFDDFFIEKLVKQLSIENNIGLLTGNPKPLKPKNFVQKAIASSYNAYYKLRYTINSGKNKWTCDGKVLVLTNKFINVLNLPENNNNMGNVDAYLYFSCLKSKLNYSHNKEAVVYFKLPSTVSDYLKWNARNNSNRYLLQEEFGDLINEQYKIPLSKKILYFGIEFLKNPIGCIFIFLAKFHAKYKGKKIAKSFNSLWDVVKTTKNITSYHHD